MNARWSVTIASMSLLAAVNATGVEPPDNYSPYAHNTGGKQLLWGDTHLHTTLSLDARAFGVQLDQDDAYRFARGETVKSTGGINVKLSRPLDFLVVSDHSDAMGTMSEIIAGNKAFMTDATAASWNQRLNSDSGATQLKARMEVMTSLTDGSAPAILSDRDFFGGIWGDYLETAEAYNEPGRFTAMIGYEWTSTVGGSNLHRNVLYRDGADLAAEKLPFTALESSNPEDLWAWMSDYEKATGGQILAMAHNGNISNGLMFPEVNPSTGEPLTAEYVQARARWEPIYEVTQIKGDGETYPLLSKNDEFADYESWDVANFAGVRKTPDMFQYEYARSALRMGLQLEQKLGTNPYQFGMIGSTDSHTALATAEENNFFGKMAYMEPRANRWNSPVGDVGGVVTLGWQMAASGYAAVWATENTREAIFDAMMRRETYATTGPRMVVHFNAAHGDQAVPMGGSLSAVAEAGGPVFTVGAMKDPIGANLDRIQIVKGWLNDDGSTAEQVFEVIWAGARALDKNGKLPALASTVDLTTATYTNAVGGSQLEATWQDPSFDPQQSAFYYVRVMEILTPRWTAYDAVRYGVTMGDEVPMTTQERAYTSPIWYQP